MKIEQEIRQKKFRNEWQKAVINLLFTHSWLQLQMKEFMKSFGITSQQYNVLRILKGQHPNPVSTNTVRDRMLDKMSDVARLQEKELVVVCKACHDKRLVDIVISDKGIKLLEAIEKQTDDMDGIVKNISNQEAEQLSDLLDKMRG
jgi:DNA-binding MarR family transcriptional regulator